MRFSHFGKNLETVVQLFAMVLCPGGAAPEGLRDSARRFNAGKIPITTTRPAGALDRRAYDTIFDPGNDLVTTADLTPLRLQGELFHWIFPALKRRAESRSPCGTKTILISPDLIIYGDARGPPLGFLFRNLTSSTTVDERRSCLWNGTIVRQEDVMLLWTQIETEGG
jgi:hypothetical protein